MNPPKPGIPARDSERRFATVVFADISGFTSLSEKMDPEDVTTLMNRCFELLEEAVTRYGGHVDKYIGDCIMALFGVPNALEHAPSLAVQAALEMMTRVQAFRREHHAPLDLHVGINSGLVLAGQVGGAKTRDFTVMGDTVNLASRLKDAASIGAIWVGPQTYRYTREEFEYETLKPLTLKGKQNKTPAYRVLGPKDRSAHRRHASAEGMIFSHLVGREHELQIVEERIARLRTGEGGIVTIVGEAGLGKSRLLAEMAELDAMREVVHLRGAALAVGSRLPYHPFVDLLRGWSAVAEAEKDQDALATLARALERVAPEDLPEMLPFLATLMGLRPTGEHAARLQGIEGEALEKLIQKSLRTLLQRLAATAPLVLVLEDLHWADASSITLLEALLRLSAEAPVLFVQTLRPDYVGPVQRMLTHIRHRFPERHVEIPLEPLSAKQCDALVRGLLDIDDLPPQTLGTILRKTQGNPFFVEEVVRSLIDEGAIELREGRFRVTDKLASVVIPGTIQDVIMGRIDRFPEAVRHVIRTASVIGRSFHHRVIAAVMPAERQLEWALRYLKKRQLVVERTVHDDVEYVFKHALAQEAIYESLLQKTRRDIHLTVAHSIERLFADRLAEFYGMLAYHFSRAENLERAEEYLFRAGDEAIRSAASSEALTYFEEASRLYLLLHGQGGDPAKKALLEKNIGLALLNQGNLVESIPHFDKALAHLGEAVPQSQTRVVARSGRDMLAVLGRLYLWARKPRPVTSAPRTREVMEVRFNRAKAQTTTDTTRFFFDTIGSIRRLNGLDPSAIDQACGMYAGGAALFSFSGVSFRIGARFLDIAKDLVREGNVRDLLVYRSMRFIHHYLEGDWNPEYGITDEITEQGLRFGQFWDTIVYLALTCERNLHQGHFAAARAQIAKLAEITDEFGSDFARSNQDYERALLLLEERDLERAEAAIDVYYATRLEKLFNLLALSWKAKLWILRGDLPHAARSLADAERIWTTLAQVPSFHRSPYLLVRFLYDVSVLEQALGVGARGQIRELKRRARRSARRALRSAARVAAERTETYRIVGRLYWLLGKETKALRWWSRSIAEGERLGARPELGRALMEVGIALRRAGRSATPNLEPARCLARARTIFDELGLAWDLEQLETAAEGAERASARGASSSRSASA